MSIGGLITSCLAGARLYEIGEDSFFYGFILGIGALMFAAKYMGVQRTKENDNRRNAEEVGRTDWRRN